MTLSFRIRDFFSPRRRVLDEVGIKPGFRVLDYGCGPGGYVSAAAGLVGAPGVVYTLDKRAPAIQMVKRIAARKKLQNVKAICSDRKTGLPDCSIDVVLLYDTFHALTDPDAVLKELHRVLTEDGIVSFSDHHLKEEQIVSRVTYSGLFRLLRKGRKTYSFSKVE
ncbi:MAG: class I SAM-dependent methyltransferase [Candidatus Coatesbacteria bacterium]|nr:class I SAM-dependent methyltransferase [Candidatus Coatesbacteria bacterium]